MLAPLRAEDALALLPVILTSGYPRERVGELPPGVAYMVKRWQPLDLLIAAEQALTSRV